MRSYLFPIACSALLFCTNCATLSGGQDQYYVCSYDTVWDTAVETAKDRPVTQQDREKGVIETGWMDVPAAERSFGIFGRQAFDDKERARLTMTVKRINEVTNVTVLETRQRWHLRGGVTTQATKWWPIEPSEEAMAAVVTRLNNKLREKGCTPS